MRTRGSVQMPLLSSGVVKMPHSMLSARILTGQMRSGSVVSDACGAPPPSDAAPSFLQQYSDCAETAEANAGLEASKDAKPGFLDNLGGLALAFLGKKYVGVAQQRVATSSGGEGVSVGALVVGGLVIGGLVIFLATKTRAA